MRAPRSIQRQTHDEDDVGRAGYSGPINDQDICCSFVGTTYSPALVRELIISGMVGALLSIISFSILYSVTSSDALAVISAIAILAGAAVVYHKTINTSAPLQRTPLKVLCYKISAAICALGAILSLVIRFDRRSYEKEARSNYESSRTIPTAYVNSFGDFMAFFMYAMLTFSFMFVIVTLLCEFYNKNFSQKAIKDYVDERAAAGESVSGENEGFSFSSLFSSGAGNRGISELAFNQIYAIAIVSLITGITFGYLFNSVASKGHDHHSSNDGAHNGAPYSASDASVEAIIAVQPPSFFCFHQLVGAAVGMICGVIIGNANNAAVEENDSARRTANNNMV